MQNSIRNLVTWALAQGHVVSVWDGEEFSTKRSDEFKKIMADIQDLDEAELFIRNGQGLKLAWVRVSDACDFAPDEKVLDYSDNAYMDEWHQHYLSCTSRPD